MDSMEAENERLREERDDARQALFNADQCADTVIKGLKEDLRDLREERHRLIGYISTMPPHSHQHPEDVLAWWEKKDRWQPKETAQ